VLVTQSSRPDECRGEGKPAEVVGPGGLVEAGSDGSPLLPFVGTASCRADTYIWLAGVSDSLIDLDDRHQASHVDHASIMPLASRCPTLSEATVSRKRAGNRSASRNGQAHEHPAAVGGPALDGHTPWKTELGIAGVVLP
jgi:hypothetical protein